MLEVILVFNWCVCRIDGGTLIMLTGLGYPSNGANNYLLWLISNSDTSYYITSINTAAVAIVQVMIDG